MSRPMIKFLPETHSFCGYLLLPKFGIPVNCGSHSFPVCAQHSNNNSYSTAPAFGDINGKRGHYCGGNAFVKIRGFTTSTFNSSRFRSHNPDDPERTTDESETAPGLDDEEMDEPLKSSATMRKKPYSFDSGTMDIVKRVAYINHVQLLGRVGKDPKVVPNYGSLGSYVIFPLVTNRNASSRDGKPSSRKQWTDVVIRGQSDRVLEQVFMSSYLLVGGRLDHIRLGHNRFKDVVLANYVIPMAPVDYDFDHKSAQQSSKTGRRKSGGKHDSALASPNPECPKVCQDYSNVENFDTAAAKPDEDYVDATLIEIDNVEQDFAYEVGGEDFVVTKDNLANDASPVDKRRSGDSVTVSLADKAGPSVEGGKPCKYDSGFGAQTLPIDWTTQESSSTTDSDATITDSGATITDSGATLTDSPDDSQDVRGGGRGTDEPDKWDDVWSDSRAINELYAEEKGETRVSVGENSEKLSDKSPKKKNNKKNKDKKKMFGKIVS